MDDGMGFMWRRFLMALTFLAAPVLLAPEPMSASETVVSVQPGEIQVAPGRVFTVAIEASEASDLGAFEFFLAFDPSVLRVMGAQAGDFLTSTGRRLVPLGPTMSSDQVGYGAATYGYEPGVSGQGVLARVTFQAVGTGTSVLHFNRLIVTDTAARVLSVRGVDGQVTSSGEWHQILLPLVTVMP